MVRCSSHCAGVAASTAVVVRDPQQRRTQKQLQRMIASLLCITMRWTWSAIFLLFVYLFFLVVFILSVYIELQFEPVGPGSNQHCELSNPPNTDEAPDAPVDLLVSVWTQLLSHFYSPLFPAINVCCWTLQIHSSAATDSPPAYCEVRPKCMFNAVLKLL